MERSLCMVCIACSIHSTYVASVYINSYPFCFSFLLSFLSFSCEEPRLCHPELLAPDRQGLHDHQPLRFPPGRAQEEGIRQGNFVLNRWERCFNGSIFVSSAQWVNVQLLSPMRICSIEHVCLDFFCKALVYFCLHASTTMRKPSIQCPKTNWLRTLIAEVTFLSSLIYKCITKSETIMDWFLTFNQASTLPLCRAAGAAWATSPTPTPRATSPPGCPTSCPPRSRPSSWRSCTRRATSENVICVSSTAIALTSAHLTGIPSGRRATAARTSRGSFPSRSLRPG